MGRGCRVRDVDYFLPLQAPRNETSAFQFLRCRKHVVCFAFALRQILLHVISMLIALQSYKFSARYTNLSLHISSRTKRFAVLHSPYVPKVRTSWHLPEVRTSPCFFLHSPCPPVRGICNQPAESIGICNPGTVIAPRYEYLYIMYSQPSSSGGFEIRPKRV